MPHKAVEAVWPGRSNIAHYVSDLGNRAKVVGHCLGCRGRLFQRSAFRHVDYHLELILVVERQHLDCHELQRQ